MEKNISSIEDNYTVAQSNSLAREAYKLTLFEKQLICYALASIDHRAPMPERFLFSIRDFAETFNRPISQCYRDTYNIIRNQLQHRMIPWVDDDGMPCQLAWIDKIYGCGIKKSRKTADGGDEIVYTDTPKDGQVGFSFTSGVAKQLSDLSNRFSLTRISTLKKFSSMYSVRLHEYAMAEMGGHDERCIHFDMAKLRALTDTEDKYLRTQSFDERVVKMALSEINANSDIRLVARKVKRGTRVVGYEFHATRKIALTKVKLTPKLVEAGQDIFRKAKQKVDIYQLAEDFYGMLAKEKKPVDNLSVAWLAFVRSRLVKCGLASICQKRTV